MTPRTHPTSGYGTRRFALALVMVAALGWSAVAAHAQSGRANDPSGGADKANTTGKTDRNPPPPPEGKAAPGVTVHTFKLDPRASREQRIAAAMSQGGLSRAEATELVDGTPSTGP